MTSGAHTSTGLVQISGPLFDGRGLASIDGYMRANMDLIARLAEDAVTSELDAVLVNPTGYYVSQIEADTRSNVAGKFDVVVHDSGVIYGPWLAGTGSRNYPVTRFKGYSHWRRAGQRIGELAKRTTVATLPQLVRKLGG